MTREEYDNLQEGDVVILGSDLGSLHKHLGYRAGDRIVVLHPPNSHFGTCIRANADNKTVTAFALRRIAQKDSPDWWDVWGLDK
jgi:hypothetical protein